MSKELSNAHVKYGRRSFLKGIIWSSAGIFVASRFANNSFGKSSRSKPLNLEESVFNPAPQSILRYWGKKLFRLNS